MSIETLLAETLLTEEFARDFGLIADLVRKHAQERPEHLAVIHGDERLTYAQFDALADRIAATLQRDGLTVGDSIAICATTSISYAATFIGAVRAGITVSPLAPSSTPESLVVMLRDSAAKLFFLDKAIATALAGQETPGIPTIALDGDPSAGRPFREWLAPEGAKPGPVAIDPALPFNIIYSSGTTGTPKGIVQSHRMRWGHVQRSSRLGYGPDAVVLLSTPLYSNTTLVSFLPTLAYGGTLVLLEKFDARRFLELAQRHRVTLAMLVPVQYRRILAVPEFDSYDLSSFRNKFCTSAPFPADVKTEVLRRWPGGLVESYGMTEGGGTCMLPAHEFPDKLHTVGRPVEGHDIRIIDENGEELPPGALGEVVGHSGAMMNGYNNQPEKTRETEWFDRTGKRFIRTGDIGRFDEDGFLTLLDRKKDMIISGGFNIYPSDLEAVVAGHPAVAEVSVVGVPSDQWGETPVGFVVLKPGASLAAGELREWANAKLGKTQRLAGVELVEALPRSAIGKVLKRELRDQFAHSPGRQAVA